MNILTWHSANASASIAWSARFKVGKQILPPIVYAATESEVVAQAQAFWDSETEKARGNRAGKHARPQEVVERICERGKPTEIVDEDDDAPAALVDDFKLLAEIKTRRATKTAESATTDDLDDLLG